MTIVQTVTFAAAVGLSFSSCLPRNFNAIDTSSQTQDFSVAKKNSVLEIVATRNTFLKNAARPVSPAEKSAAADICFVKAGTKLKLQKKVEAKNSKAGHYLVAIEGEIPGVSLASFSEDVSKDKRFETFRSKAPIAYVEAVKVDFDFYSKVLTDIEIENETLPETTNSEIESNVGMEGHETELTKRGSIGYPAEKAELSDAHSVLNLNNKLPHLPQVQALGEESTALAYANQLKACPFNKAYAFKSDWIGSVLENEDDIPELIVSYIKSFENCASGAAYVAGGGSCNRALDCSNSIYATYRKMKLPIQSIQTDSDPNFVKCTGGYRPGDHLLLSKSTIGAADHWVTLKKVVNNKVGNSSKNQIVDMSSDCNGRCPGAMRSNISSTNRNVVACTRHKAFAKAWKDLHGN